MVGITRSKVIFWIAPLLTWFTITFDQPSLAGGFNPEKVWMKPPNRNGKSLKPKNRIIEIETCYEGLCHNAQKNLVRKNDTTSHTAKYHQISGLDFQCLVWIGINPLASLPPVGITNLLSLGFVLVSVVRISTFSDFEATHAKQGYRYRVVPYRQ